MTGTTHEIQSSDGRLLHVHEGGDPQGHMVLVHHGTPGSGLLWDRWTTEAAGSGIRLVSYDRPGYGQSSRDPGRTVAAAAADAVTIADALGVQRFYTWGASGGGPHALTCAALLPDRVIAAATIASVAPYAADGLDWYDGMGQDNLDEFGAAVNGEEPVRRHLEKISPELVRAEPDLLAEVMRSLLPPVDAEALTGDFAGFLHAQMVGGQRGGVDGWVDDDLAFTTPWGFDLASIQVPVLLLQGRLDKMVPFAHGQWLATRIPGVEARFAETEGHLSLWAKVAEVHAWLLTR